MVQRLAVPAAGGEWGLSVFGVVWLSSILLYILLGRVAQSVGHLARKSEVLGSIPGLATYFRFSFC